MYKVLLKEGPVGHMAHPYENLTLKFSELKELFKLVVDGFPDVEVTEKLDGQNIIVTYDHDSGKALAIRRMAEHSAMGGIDKDAIRKFFTVDKIEKSFNALMKKGLPEKEARKKSQSAAIEHVADAFYDAMDNFERAAAQMPKEFFETKEGCKIFYNGEVIDPRSRNIVDYDTQDLVLHRSKHSKLCPASKKLESMDDKEAELYSKYIEKFLTMFQDSNTDVPKIKMNALLNFDNIIVDEEILHKAEAALDTVINSAGLGEESTIRDFLKKTLDEVIEAKIPDINNEIADMVADSIIFYLTEKTIPRFRSEINPILDLVSSETTKEIITNLLRDRATLAEIIRNAIRPIEMVVHNFAVDYLKGIRSLYILNHDQVLSDLQKKVGHKATSIQAQPAPGELATLKRQIRKLLNDESDPEEVLMDDDLLRIYDRISSTVEGLVFTFNGQQYKITGQFAPINQIMGMGRFSRGDGKREDKLLQEHPSPATYENLSNIGDFEPEWGDMEHEPISTSGTLTNSELDSVAVYSGGFKPPHAGHFLASRYLAETAEAEKLIILIGSSPRYSKDKSIKIGPEESSMMWNLFYKDAPGVKFNVEIVNISGSPVRWVYDQIEEGAFGSANVYVGVGQCASDPEGCDIEMMSPEDARWSALVSSGRAEQIIIPLQGEIKGQTPRGSIMRELLASNDDRFMNYMPDHLSDLEKLDLRNKLVNKEYLK